ncbi:MAG: hypothetical protein ACR2OG_07660 [Gemmatimonadaceae bacterium]
MSATSASAPQAAILPTRETSPFSALAEASRLLAASLDYETTLATAARPSMPALGAWCIVDLLLEDGTMRRLAVVHPDPLKQAVARKLEI